MMFGKFRFKKKVSDCMKRNILKTVMIATMTVSFCCGFNFNQEVTQVYAITETATPIAYTFTDLKQVMCATSYVEIYSLPNATGNKIGSLITNQPILVTGQCNESLCYRVDFNGNVGYISNEYLSTELQAIEATAQPNEVDADVCPYELYTIYYDNLGFPYYYGKWGGSANMDADNWAKTEACSNVVSEYMFQKHIETYGETGGSSSWSGSWELIGKYQGMHVVVRFVASVNDASVGSLESRGIATAGNGIWKD